ncbi:hypothetical protein F5141DRAFT_1011230 [Pisolithus sp. B1]|nr:hypothetical protein F5141DRAFT_1011230 [Pisolithus sp. B1]
MPWPDTVICQFEIIPLNPNGNDFYGAYNKLLSTLFPSDTDFTVVPRHLEPCSSQSCTPMVFFEVVLGTKPVFILKPQAPADLTYGSSRQTADQEIRLRLGDLAEQCPIPTLHAVSAMGMRLCFYHVDTTHFPSEIIPHGIPRHPTRVNDTAPKERWDCDVLDANGEARLRAVVDAIKEACENITNV